MSPYWLALLGAIATSMGGQTLLKAGAGAADFVGQLLDPRTMVGLVLYGARQMASSGFGTGGRRPLGVDKYLGPVKRWLQDFF